MNKIRFLFLTVLCAFGFSVQRSEAQIAGQTMTFSIICQYITNTASTNLQSSQVTTVQHLETVLISSVNLVHSIALDLFDREYTNQGALHINWNAGHLIYEQNLLSGEQGVFLRAGRFQTDVSSYFINTNFSAGGYSNIFSTDANAAFASTLYVTNTTLTNSPFLPIAEGYVYSNSLTSEVSSNFTLFDNLAYVDFDTTNFHNTQFRLFGYSEGHLIGLEYAGLYHKLNQAHIVAAGTFRMNLTTNLFNAVDGQMVTNPYHTNVVYTITNAVTPLYLSGLAHGTINFSAPYLIPGVTNGPGQ
jgi:hypothetical protein